jgi:hypothetical protein
MRLPRSARTVLLVLAAILTSVIISPAAAGAHPSGFGLYICRGGTIPSGSYRSMLVTGICYVPAGSVAVQGNLTVAPGALFDALDPQSGQLGTALPGTVTVGGSITVGQGAVLALGCGADLCDPSLGTPDDRVGGSITASGALAVIVHAVTIRGDLTVIGGGGGPAYAGSPGSGACLNVSPPLFNDDPGLAGIPAFSGMDDNTIGGSLTILGVQTCWLGGARNNVRHDSVFIGNKTGSPDGDEVISNTVHGNIACFRNNHVVQFGDGGGTPNVVSGNALGECGFGVYSPDPDLPPGTPQPISVKAGADRGR